MQRLDEIHATFRFYLKIKSDKEDMKTLHIDIETYSSVDLLTRGVYNYAEADDFQVLLFAYSVDGGEVKIVDLAMGETLPEEILDAILDPRVFKLAFNAQFERVCLSAMIRKMSKDGKMPKGSEFSFASHDGKYLSPAGWVCVRVLASASGYPGSLAFVGKAMGLPQDKAKMKEGSRLIRLFSIPNKLGGRYVRVKPEDHPEDWALFKAYCIRDVEAEMEIQERTKQCLMNGERWKAVQCYTVDQFINDRGVGVDIRMLINANLFAERRKAELEELLDMAGLKNKPEDIKAYLHRIIGTPENISLNAETLTQARKRIIEKYGHGEKLSAIDAYIELQVKSVKKYETLKDYVSPDFRLRGAYYYFGARTGRWSSRGVQIHNMPRLLLSEQATAELRRLLRTWDYVAFKKGVFRLRDRGEKVGGVMQALGQLFRTVFRPRHGNKMLTMDYKTIEPRILARLAGEVWMQECFLDGKDIYEETARRIFGLDIVDRETRQKAKIAAISLGYGAGATVLESVAKGMGVKLAPGEAADIVKRWRQSCPNIVKLWNRLERAASDAVRKKGTPDAAVDMANGIRLFMRGDNLLMSLPTNDTIVYPNARLLLGPDVKNMERDSAVGYDGASATGKEWVTSELYGGKLTENAVQAMARDVLAETLITFEFSGVDVVMHTHDEVTLDVDPEEADPDALKKCFCSSMHGVAKLEADSSGLCDYYSK